MVVKAALLVIGIVVSILAYTIAYACALCAIYRTKAIGLVVLRNSPLYWLLMVLIIVGEAWFGKQIVLK